LLELFTSMTYVIEVKSSLSILTNAITSLFGLLKNYSIKTNISNENKNDSNMNDVSQTDSNTKNPTLISVYPFKIIQKVSKVLLFIVKTNSEVFRSDTWKEIGGIDMTIKLLSSELNQIHLNTSCVNEFKNTFNAKAINTIISQIHSESSCNLIMTESEHQTDEKLAYIKNLFRLLKYIMLKSDISNNQIGGSINVARLIIDSELLELSVSIIKFGPRQLIRSTVELVCEIMQNIPTSINTLVERNVIASMAELFQEKYRSLHTEEKMSMCYLFYILEFHNATRNMYDLKPMFKI